MINSFMHPKDVTQPLLEEVVVINKKGNENKDNKDIDLNTIFRNQVDNLLKHGFEIKAEELAFFDFYPYGKHGFDDSK
jgi:hypothetical protein